jgi:hypothetical protein
MKFYETHYEEYLNSIKKANLHPELTTFVERLPEKSTQMGNLIVYGPTGVGKYSQVLQMLKKYSPSHFKYEKKITIQTDKHTYTYHISDIHYEIDMSLLGCNSKILWNEIFLQIVDIISVKTEKVGFIVCKNFHMIHGELLDIFYSYIQQYSESCSSKYGLGGNIIIHFIIITENVSFLPNNILQACHIVNVGRPSKEDYKKIPQLKSFPKLEENLPADQQHKRSENLAIIDTINSNEIINIKELYSFTNITDEQYIPKDIFNVVCDNIINEILNYKKLTFSGFRDVIYDILVYNLDMVECLWYILYYLISFHSEQSEPREQQKSLSKRDISDILKKTHTFLKYYNNNYRPIYHLESMLFYIIVKLYHYEL